MWARICQMYDQVRAENPKDIGPRNENQMKGHFKRLSKNRSKRVAPYTAAYSRKTSGMNLKDVELDAHKIYEGDGSKFLYLIVFNEYMCKHPKWKLNLDRDKTRLQEPNEESCGSTKRSRVSEEGDYVVHSNQETPNSGGSTIQRPTVLKINMSSDSDYESISSDSDSSSISSNSVKYHEWESRVVQYNQHIDRILEDVIINYPNLVIQDQRTRAKRVYRDREREQVDAMGRLSLSPLPKCASAMRVLAYGASFDVVDEYLRMSGAVTRKSLMVFVLGVISCFGDKYLRRPNEDDLARLLYVGEQRGFPEVVASYDLRIWLAFFGTPGPCNDINVLHRSSVFSDVLEGRAPKVSYVVNGHQKNMAYCLTDGIYPSWAVFVKSTTSPQIRKPKLFAQHQEAIRKDVERAFGVLQARFAFLRRPCLIWD
ncbi:putative nuclease HARBI1 [Tanacetum coccineum]